jgi:hypothetical protein
LHILAKIIAFASTAAAKAAVMTEGENATFSSLAWWPARSPRQRRETHPSPTQEAHMATAKESLSRLNEIEGFIGACIVDSNSGMMLGSIGGGGELNLELAAAGNTEVVRAKRKTMKSLNLNDPIEDILITLGKQYHLIRPLTTNDALFVYVALDRKKANLALARHHLSIAEKDLAV